MIKSFKAALAAYPTTSHPADSTRKPPRLSPADRAHLKRWADDERADKVWSTINSAAQKRGRVIPDRFFIQEVLGARDIAASINHRRKHRDQYRKYAAQMERNAASEAATYVQKGFSRQIVVDRLNEVARSVGLTLNAEDLIDGCTSAATVISTTKSECPLVPVKPHDQNRLKPIRKERPSVRKSALACEPQSEPQWAQTAGIAEERTEYTHESS